MNRNIDLVNTTPPFLAYLEEWYNRLPDLALAELVAGAPERTALLAIDVIDGFCKDGPLASARVGRIARPVADLFALAYELGVRDFALTHDAHDPDAPEFQVYRPHCLAGTRESEAVDELRALPFFGDIAIVPKHSLSSHLGTALGTWVRARPQIDRFVVGGDCTDLCAYQAAMHLRLEANVEKRDRRVIVAAAACETFDTPVLAARRHGAKAHDGDLHHVLFLHHMAMNGIEVVGRLI